MIRNFIERKRLILTEWDNSEESKKNQESNQEVEE